MRCRVCGRDIARLEDGEIRFAHRGFSAQARDQRLLAMLQLIQIVNVTPLGRHLGAQPLKLSFVVPGVFAHASTVRPEHRFAREGGCPYARLSTFGSAVGSGRARG